MSKILLEKLRVIAENYPIESLLEQNDIDPMDVLLMLYKKGMFDPSDYVGADDELYGDDYED
jgi:hypothetical protein